MGRMSTEDGRKGQTDADLLSLHGNLTLAQAINPDTFLSRFTETDTDAEMEWHGCQMNL